LKRSIWRSHPGSRAIFRRTASVDRDRFGGGQKQQVSWSPERDQQRQDWQSEPARPVSPGPVPRGVTAPDRTNSSNRCSRAASVRSVEDAPALASGLWVEGWRWNAPPQWHCVFNFHDLSLPSRRQPSPFRRAVIDDLLHYAPHQARRIALLERCQPAFSDRQLARVSSLLNALRSWKHDRSSAWAGRDCLGGRTNPIRSGALLAT